MKETLRWIALGLVSSGIAGAQPAEEPKVDPHTYEVVGGIAPGREPDGNTYVLEGAKGLTVIDTGRHPAHLLAIEALARKLNKPVVAIINTHWHLDHVSGNPGLKAAYPGAKVYASAAINEALTGFLAESAGQAKKLIDSGKMDATSAEEVRLDLATYEHGDALKPDVVVDGPRTFTLGGLRLELHVAKDAATAGDVWVFDPSTKTAYVGDLITFPAPFLDTACAQGWSDALGEIEATSFQRAAPGHGPVLTRTELAEYRAAFDGLIACSKTTETPRVCGDRWVEAVGGIGKMSEDDKKTGRGMAAYYVADVLRPNGGNSRYCAKGK